MSVVHLFEDFGDHIGRSSGAAGALTEEVFETRRLEAFEQGYSAGWDDAVRAQQDDQSRISGDFAQNLADLSFTYQEAYSSVTNAMTPLLQQIVDSLLPELVREALGGHIVEQLKSLVEEQGARRVELVIAPGNRPALEKLVEAQDGLDAVITEDSTLGEGQAHLRFGDAERQIDLDEVLAGIAAALSGFTHENGQEARYG